MDKELLLNKYLQDKLTGTEREEFDALLKSDDTFKEEVDFQMDVQRAVTADEDEHFRNMLSDFESEAKTNVSKASQAEQATRKIFSTKWLAAASIAALMGFTYFFTMNNDNVTKELFAENFRPYRNVTYPITRGEEVKDTKTKAFLAYSKGEYKDAIPLFSELYASDRKAYYLFYKANALIQVNRAKEAIPLLQEHLKTQDALTDKSNWYLAMAYLQLQDTEKTKEALKKVVATEGYKTEEAKQLLDAL